MAAMTAPCLRLAVCAALLVPRPSAAWATAGDSLAHQAQVDNPARYEEALRHGAQIVVTPDLRSFYVLWFPEGVTHATARGMILTLHGHGSWATDEFALWRPHAATRGYGIIALQWWFGGGSSHLSEYYAPEDLYPLIEGILREQGIRQGTVLLHGFSRGASNSYALTALDRHRGRGLFRLTVANAGGATMSYPPNQAIERGAFGPAPFSGTHWALFCGGKDPHPERDGCPAMDRTQAWLRTLGATVHQLIADPDMGHGGFHRNPANIDVALRIFDRLLEHPAPAGPAAPERAPQIKAPPAAAAEPIDRPARAR